jgi:signal transduction histidine kinase
MAPRVVLHKLNGHRRAPDDPVTSPGEVVRMVRSDRIPPVMPASDRIAGARAVRREKRSALLDQVARGIESLRSSLSAVLARTQAAFDRGVLPDVQEALRAIEAQAEMAARLVEKLSAAVRLRSGARRLLDVNETIAEVLAELTPRLPPTVQVVTGLDPRLPRVLGDSRLLQQALADVISCTGQAMGEAPTPGTITVETSHSDRLLQGEAVVRVRITSAWPAAPTTSTAPGLARASMIVAEHGGGFSVEDLPAGAGITIELRAA